MDSSSSTPTLPATRGAWLRAIFGPLIFVFALGAVHYVMTVPKSEMIARKKKGKKDKKKDKKKKKKGNKFPLYQRYASETVDVAFARTHDPVMTFAAEVAQAAVFSDVDEKPEPFLRTATCRRWHCQYKMCGERQELSEVIRILKALEHEDDTLFDSFETKVGKDIHGDHCTRVIIRFSRPNPEVKGIRVDKGALERVHRSRAARRKSEKMARQRKDAKTDKEAKAEEDAKVSKDEKAESAKKPSNEDMPPKKKPAPAGKPALD